MFVTFKSLSIVDLYAATFFHKFLINVDLAPINTCKVRRLQKPHKSHRSNSQDFQELQKPN